MQKEQIKNYSRLAWTVFQIIALLVWIGEFSGILIDYYNYEQQPTNMQVLFTLLIPILFNSDGRKDKKPPVDEQTG